MHDEIVFWAIEIEYNDISLFLVKYHKKQYFLVVS